MHTESYPSPLTPTTPDNKCGHNAFVHHIFPHLVQRNRLATLDELAASPESASAFLAWAMSITNETIPVPDDFPALHLRDIAVTLEFGDRYLLGILSLTKPEHSIGAYFIGLLSLRGANEEDEPLVRYFTLERTADNETVLCERTSNAAGDFTHRNYGAGPQPVVGLFSKAIMDFLDFERASIQS